MNVGEMRLHWEEQRPNGVLFKWKDFPCLDDALNHAGWIYGMDQGTLTRLENWMGEDACPPDQLLPVAEMRWKVAQSRAGFDAEQAKLESNPLFGLF